MRLPTCGVRRVLVLVLGFGAAGTLFFPALPAIAEPGFSSEVDLPGGPNGSNVGLPAGGNDLSCVGPTWCSSVLVGGPDAPSREPSAPDTETDGTWGTPVSLAPPTGATEFLLNSISCPSVGSCLAVGYDTVSGVGQEPVVATEIAGVWSDPVQIAAPSPPDPAAFEVVRLDAVQCLSAGNCVVAGYEWGAESATSPASTPTFWFTATQSAGTWTAPTMLTEPAASQATGPVALACVSLTRCVIAASHGPPPWGRYVTSTWTEVGGTWGAPEQVAAQGKFFASAIACPGPSTCLLVGSTQKPQLPAYLVQSGTAWSAPRTLPLPRLSPRAQAGQLDEISCASGSLCVADGTFFVPGGADLGGLVTWSGGTWSSFGYLSASSGRAGNVDDAGGSTALGGISCPTSSMCEVDGGASYAPPISSGADPATNWFDFSETVSPRRQITRPGAPVGVKAFADHGAIRARWSPPQDDGGAPVRWYVAIVGGTAVRCRTAADACVLRGFRSGRYRLRVITVSRGGDSRPGYSGVVALN